MTTIASEHTGSIYHADFITCFCEINFWRL